MATSRWLATAGYVNMPPVDLCADADISVCLHDCNESDVLSFQFEGLSQCACLGTINIPALNLNLAQLEGNGVVINGLGTVTYDAATGDFHLAVDPNGQLAYLGYGETADIKFEVTATDLAGCSDSTCFDFTATGGDHAPTIEVCHDLCLVLPGCADPCASDAVLSDTSQVCISDPDCGQTACFEKVVFGGFTDSACGINIAPATWTAAQLEIGVNIQTTNGDVIGKLLYDFGDLTFVVNPNCAELQNLECGHSLQLSFNAFATDGLCDSSTCFNVDITGGNEGYNVIQGCNTGGNINCDGQNDIIYCNGGNNQITCSTGIDHCVFDLQQCFSNGGPTCPVDHIIDFCDQDVLSFCHINTSTGALTSSCLTQGIDPCVTVQNEQINGQNCIVLSVDCNHDGKIDGQICIDGHQTSDFYGATAANFLSVLEQHHQLICANTITHA